MGVSLTFGTQYPTSPVALQLAKCCISWDIAGSSWIDPGLILDDPPGPKEAQNDGSSPQNRGTGAGSCPAVQHGMAMHGGTAGLRCQVLKGRKGASKVRLGCLEIAEPRQKMDPDGPGIMDDGSQWFTDVRKAQSPEESDAGSDSAEAAPAN